MNKAVVSACLSIVLMSAVAKAQTPRVGQDMPQPGMPQSGMQRPDLPKTALARQYLFGRLSGGMTLDRYLTSLRTDFVRHDADGNGVVDESDVDLQIKVTVSNLRTGFVMQVFSADLDGDGVVTEQELRRKLTYDQRRIGATQAPAVIEQRIEQNFRKLMEADANKDGRIAFKEVLDRGASQPAFAQQYQSGMRRAARQMLSLAPEGKSSLMLADVEAVATAFFNSVDSDGNGTISLDELDARRKEVNRDRVEIMNEMMAASAVAACHVPKASANAKVVLLGGYQTQSLSTVALGSQDDVTGVGNIVVEPGTEPLYILISSYRPTIWRFYGAVERVERAVIVATHGVKIKKDDSKPRNAVGATGLPAERLTFPDNAGCVRYFSQAPSTQASQVTAAVKAMTGKAPDTVAAKYAMISFNVPSGKIESVGGDRPGLAIVQNGVTFMLKDGKVTVVKPDRSLTSDLDRFSPGGVVTIDAKAVVASVPAEPYEVLPEQAGLIQLVGSGALTRNGGEFIINRKIRMPAGLAGAHSVKFLLRRGVPEPEGDYGHSTVISEETGKPVQPHKG